jgi:magnesium-transporting ATPase (P-type)
MGLRYLAVAMIQNVDINSMNLKNQAQLTLYESNLLFLDLIDIIDPPHQVAKEAIAKCRVLVFVRLLL